MAAISSQAIDAGSDQKMSAELHCCTEQLVNVALAIADMDTARRFAEQRRRLAQVFQPADALLVLDRNPRWVDFLLKGGGALELLAGPELDGG